MSGPTISDRIGEQITWAWRIYAEAGAADPWITDTEREHNRRQKRGRILGLAQALAIIRHAPATPTTQQIKAIAEEFKP